MDQVQPKTLIEYITSFSLVTYLILMVDCFVLLLVSLFYAIDESSRVFLQPIRGLDGSDYINASFVDVSSRTRPYSKPLFLTEFCTPCKFTLDTWLSARSKCCSECCNSPGSLHVFTFFAFGGEVHYTHLVPASARNSRHTSSVSYCRNFLLVFSTFLLVFVCVIIDNGLYGAAEPL